MQVIAKFDDAFHRVVAVEVTTDGGLVETKYLSFNDFLDILEGAKETTERMLTIGRLPKGYYKGSIDQRVDKSYRCVIVVPAGVKPVSYYDDVYTVPFPSLVFSFVVKKGAVTKSYCFSVSDDNPTEESALYHYPFANVYSDGRICWGTNTLENVCELHELDKITAQFFGAGTNNDLYDPGNNIMVTEETANLRGFFLYLSEKKEFPKELLVPVDIKLGELE